MKPGNKLTLSILVLLGNLMAREAFAVECTTADVVVYGGTPAGISAAIQAGRMKKSVILLEPTQHVGGMMSSGLNKTDASPRQGAKIVYGGIAKEFFARSAEHYKQTGSEGTYFESKWAESTFEALLANAKVKVVYGERVVSVVKTAFIKRITMKSGSNFCGSVFIDASYEGDLMLKARVTTVLGRESRTQYAEKDAGAQLLTKPELDDGTPVAIDPYLVPGDPSSGLIPGVISEKQKPVGSADTNLMAYNYRICVTDNRSKQAPFSRPADYDPMQYEGLARFISQLVTSGYGLSPRYFIGNGNTVLDKYDVNSNRWFSTNVFHLGAAYANGTEAQREQIRQRIRSYTQGYFYFGQTDPRVPQSVRDATAKFGYCADEFVDNGNFPYQVYVRQSRRLVGQFVLTENNIVNKTKFTDSIGLGYYPMDQHGMLRTMLNGVVVDDTRKSVSSGGPYEIPYRAMLPKANETKNLLVPVALSASHVAYTSVRVEPTYMVLGQAAGAAAALAVKGDVGKVDVKTLRSKLVAAKAVVNWEN